MKAFTYTITDPEGIHARPARPAGQKSSGIPLLHHLEKGRKNGRCQAYFRCHEPSGQKG